MPNTSTESRTAADRKWFAENRESTIKSAALGNLWAMEMCVAEHQAEMRDMDPSAFEGSPESGPYCPKSSVERALSTAAHEMRSERVQRAIEQLPANVHYHVLIAVASAADVSALHIARKYLAHHGESHSAAYRESITRLVGEFMGVPAHLRK